MIIDCIADTHGEYPELEGGDLLIVAGDLTTNNTETQYDLFGRWLLKQNYKIKVIVAGNHDGLLQRENVGIADAEYLCDDGIEFEGLKIWGSPWTKWFEGVNPHCTAFMLKTEQELNEKWSLIPNDIDIVVTHSPMYGIFDTVADRYNKIGRKPKLSLSCGCPYLRKHVLDRVKPRLHVCGHIHEHGGKMIDLVTTKCVNASIVNEEYNPVNKPVRVIL
jgi:Icc-related predicted phosphoesterase